VAVAVVDMMIDTATATEEVVAAGVAVASRRDKPHRSPSTTTPGGRRRTSYRRA